MIILLIINFILSIKLLLTVKEYIQTVKDFEEYILEKLFNQQTILNNLQMKGTKYEKEN